NRGPAQTFIAQSLMPAAPANRPVPRLGARRALRTATLGATLATVPLGCGTPGVRGVAGTAPAPNVLWTPPRDATAATKPAPPPALPPDLAAREGGRRRRLGGCGGVARR